jgi:CelD/BcsL family acetyltransferase involved in cellulose biosynthesis
LEEIEFLHEQLPQSIHLYTAHVATELVAGAILFDLGTVRHTQYLATSSAGRQIGALDAVIEAAIKAASDQDLRYFDFGTSNLEEGRILNNSLYSYKRSFGAGSAVHEHFSLPLDDSLHDLPGGHRI